MVGTATRRAAAWLRCYCGRSTRARLLLLPLLLLVLLLLLLQRRLLPQLLPMPDGAAAAMVVAAVAARRICTDTVVPAAAGVGCGAPVAVVAAVAVAVVGGREEVEVAAAGARGLRRTRTSAATTTPFIRSITALKVTVMSMTVCGFPTARCTGDAVTAARRWCGGPSKGGWKSGVVNRAIACGQMDAGGRCKMRPAGAADDMSTWRGLSK